MALIVATSSAADEETPLPSGTADDIYEHEQVSQSICLRIRMQSQ